MEEVEAVMEFVKMLLNMGTMGQSDIGIVSPYKLQCKIIKQKCDKINYKEIQIGSAEVFQGQEKSVMIVSTVRSGRSVLGDFLANAQVRFIWFSFDDFPPILFNKRILKKIHLILYHPEIKCHAYTG